MFRLKYSLFYGRDGVRIVGYDNERGKGDHKHLGVMETRYRLVSVEKLVADFLADVEAGEGAADESDAEDQIFFVHLGKGAGKRRGEMRPGRALRAAAGRGHGVFTAGVQRRAFQEAPTGEPEADDRAMTAQGVDRVVRARRGETAAAAGTEENGERGRKDALIKPHEHNQSGRRQADET